MKSKNLLCFLAFGLFFLSATAQKTNPFKDILVHQNPVSDVDVPTRQLIAEDLYVQGSLGIGVDMANNAPFSFDTFIMRENNLRIYFDDTSVAGGGFPANDWRLTANDSGSGGENYFSIDDATAGTQVFRVDAAAGNNALRIDSDGNVGLGTGSPVLDLHMINGDTPGLRLDQNTSAGFAAQAWDIAANEANFFVRDVTNGSTLPFRIQPGTSTDALTITNTNSIGVSAGTFTSINSNASIELGASNKGLQLNRMTTAQRTTFEASLGTDDLGMIVYDSDELQAYFWNGTSWQTGLGTDDQTIDVFQLNGNDLELSIEADGIATQTVDLSGYLDNTDDQAIDVFQLNGNDLELSIEDDGAATQTVDLSGYLDNTDSQTLSFSGTDLSITGGNTVDLSALQDGTGTDDQTLNLSANTLSIEDGNSVDLATYLDNTDNQTLNFSGTDLSIVGGNTVDLSSLQDGAGTDDQNLTLSANTLSIEDGNSVNLAGYLDNTDDQQVSLSGNVLSVENGGTVDLTPFLDNTDDQILANFILSGTILNISIQDGNTVQVNLAPMLESLQDQIDAQQVLINDLISRVEIIEECACDGTLGMPTEPGRGMEAILYQNIPNPFNSTSRIKYFLPQFFNTAEIIFTDSLGRIVSQIQLEPKNGEGEIHVNSDGLASAVYNYTLIVDGERIDTKRMVIK